MAAGPPDRAPGPITHFLPSPDGPWEVLRLDGVVGPSLEGIERVSVVNGWLDRPRNGSAWPLRGVMSYGRYMTRSERTTLEERQPRLGRPGATCAALIPISKSPRWWDLTQDERRAILEERSAHIATGLRYLPAVARRLYHGRDLGEPFDFLTWFEYAPRDARAFEELLACLRWTEEWRYVVREVDIRLRAVVKGA